MNDKHYLTVISHGPLMILRVPYPMPHWRSILKAMTTVMHSHGLRQKDIVALEGMVSFPEDRPEGDNIVAARLDDAFAGGNGFAPFMLYEWEGEAFKKVRDVVKSHTPGPWWAEQYTHKTQGGRYNVRESGKVDVLEVREVGSGEVSPCGRSYFKAEFTPYIEEP
jgi:hypothetical protein